MVPHLQDIQTFLVVCETGGMGKAANILQLSTNAVSQRIKRLESQLGVQLLNRSTRSLSPTAQGQQLLSKARLLLSELESILEDISPHPSELAGVVRLGLPSGMLSEYVLKQLNSLLISQPKLHLQIEILNDPAEVISRNLDLGITPFPPRDLALISRKIGSVSWKLCAAPDYVQREGLPQTLAELSQHRCLCFLSNPPQRLWDLLDTNNNLVSVAVSGPLESNDSRLLGDAVYAGLGIGVRSQRELLDAVASNKLIPVLPDYTFQAIDVLVLYSRGRLKSRKVKAVYDALTEALRWIE
ncbi:MAG: LysR family transcriptional regulator [Candidatus Sericytochromatia bacterium]